MPASLDDRARQLRAFRLFAGVDEDVLADLAGRAHARSLRAGERLWRAGDRAEHFTLIRAGLLKIVRHVPDGAEAIVGLFGPRESVGDAAVLGATAYPADAVAASDTASVLRVEAAPVLAAMTRRPSVAAAMNRALLDHTQALQEKVAVMSAGSVDQRLATLLLLLAERFGDVREDGVTVVPVRLSRQELSRLVGATVETTIRAMSRWQKASVVDTTAEGFVLRDAARLERVTRGEK